MHDGIYSSRLWEPFCFFLISVGYTIGWTIISSMLATFKANFGPAILLQLNIAYFLPSIPVLFLQSQYDSVIDDKVGLPRAMAVRMVLGLGGAGLLSALFPVLSYSLTSVLVMTTLLGLCCGSAFASSYQFVSHFGARCSKALTIGFVGSGPLVLLIEVADRIGPNPAKAQQILLYTIAAFFTCTGLASSLGLLFRNWEALLLAGKGKQPWRSGASNHGQSDLLESGLGEVLAGSNSQLAALNPSGQATYRPARQRSSDEGSDLSSQPESSEGSASSWSPDSQRAGRDMWLLAAEIWPAAAALASNACCATLLFPFFTFVTSSGRLGPLLPQALFFARTGSDIVGRFIPHTWLPDSRGFLHLMTITKLAATPLAFWYIMACPFRSDVVAVVYIALFWLQSGLVNSMAFVQGEKWSNSPVRGRAGGVLAFVFQLSCLVALGIAFFLQRFAPQFSSQWT